MTLNEIKQAVNEGKKVHWVNTGYEVIKDCVGQYLIKYTNNYIGLTWQDGITLNCNDPSEFFIGT